MASIYGTGYSIMEIESQVRLHKYSVCQNKQTNTRKQNCNNKKGGNKKYKQSFDLFQKQLVQKVVLLVTFIPKWHPRIQHPLNILSTDKNKCKMFQMTVIDLIHPIN